MILICFSSCSPLVPAETGTPTPGETFGILATASAIQTAGTDCPPENWPCPSEDLTLTAEMMPTFFPSASIDSEGLTAQMGLTFAAIPSLTPPPWATIIPATGDLGWGSVYGKIIDGVTNLPVEGATVKCEHFSYTSPYPCYGVTTTNGDGIFSFSAVFFHDTDRITLLVEAPGYVPLRFEQAFFTRPEFHADLGLFPMIDETSTPTPLPMCTAPACSGGSLACGNLTGCPGGCGTVCLTATHTP